MAIPNLPNSRTLVDANFVSTQALPAASGTATSTPFDLGNAPYSASEHFNVNLIVPACPNLTSTSDTITFTFKHCATVGGSYVAIPETATYVLTGVASTGTAAVNFAFKLQPGTLEFIEVSAVATSGTGNNTAVSWTVQLQF